MNALQFRSIPLIITDQTHQQDSKIKPKKRDNISFINNIEQTHHKLSSGNLINVFANSNLLLEK